MTRRDLGQTRRLIAYVLDSACATADPQRNPSGRICCLFDLAGLRARVPAGGCMCMCKRPRLLLGGAAACRGGMRAPAIVPPALTARLRCACNATDTRAGLRPRNLDVKALLAIFDTLQHHFPERLDRWGGAWGAWAAWVVAARAGSGAPQPAPQPCPPRAWRLAPGA